MKYEDHKAWLATLKVGDKVCVSGVGWRSAYTIYKIERETATQFVTSKKNGLGVPYEVRIRKSDGRIIGSDSYYSIQPLTEKVLEVNERANLEAWASGINPKSLSMECLRAMKQAHDQNRGVV